jgi:hypothetical protein
MCSLFDDGKDYGKDGADLCGKRISARRLFLSLMRRIAEIAPSSIACFSIFKTLQ